jgi:hypothetical protein
LQKRWQEGRGPVEMDLSGRLLLIVAAVVFSMTVFWVYRSMDSIKGSSIQTTSERNLPIFEPDDEELTPNRSEANVPKPMLLTTPTQAPSSEPAEIAADPQVSEAGEFASRKPSAEGANKPSEAIEKDSPLSDRFGSSTSLAESNLLQTKAPLSGTASLESPSLVDAPALYQGLAQPTAEPYTDETLLPVSSQTVPSETPVSTEDTSPQPPEPVTDTGTSTLPPEPSGETMSPSYLPAASPLVPEDKADLTADPG